MTDYKTIRQSLHSHPQTAGDEQFAHDTIIAQLQSLHPDHVYTHVGGWGVVAVWGSDPNAPTIAFRADTDALPIGHRCGHDGHTTILLRLAELIDERFSTSHPRSSILLLWQPAEETGEGARAVLESGILQQYNIVRFYALHNLPGYPMGEVVICERTFAAASSGVVYHLDGRETHASTPELGINPGLAVGEIIHRFSEYNHHDQSDLQRFRQATLICVQLGAPAFGTSAGHADIMFTLRAFTNSGMEQMLSAANATVDEIARRHGLTVGRMLREPFRATENDPGCVDEVKATLASHGVSYTVKESPFRWSEDFAEYLTLYRGMMLGIGSGEHQPELHHPDYEFPDALIEPAASLFATLAI